jgi:hypothetical protein
MDSRKCASGHVMLNFCFCIRVRSVGHVVHFSASRAQNINALFFMLGSDRYGFQKNRAGTHYSKLIFCIRWDLWVT